MDLRKELVSYMDKEINNIDGDPKLKEAMAYSLISNGKMIRPLIFLRYIQGRKLNPLNYLNVAMGIEMIHVYSLIHDDLPAMDDDKLRRGLPTNHIKYGEDIAILAGDALLTHSFEQIAKTKCDANIALEMVKYLVDCAGANQGMINGQVLDMENVGEVNLVELEAIHVQKTARMIELPLVLAAFLCDDKKYLEELKIIAHEFGLAYQIRDDYLDYYGKEALIGKEVGKDRDNSKKTYVDFYTKDEIETEMTNLTASVINRAMKINLSSDLIDMFKKLEKREG